MCAFGVGQWWEGPFSSAAGEVRRVEAHVRDRSRRRVPLDLHALRYSQQSRYSWYSRYLGLKMLTSLGACSARLAHSRFRRRSAAGSDRCAHTTVAKCASFAVCDRAGEGSRGCGAEGCQETRAGRREWVCAIPCDAVSPVRPSADAAGVSPVPGGCRSGSGEPGPVTKQMWESAVRGGGERLDRPSPRLPLSLDLLTTSSPLLPLLPLFPAVRTQPYYVCLRA